MSDIPEVLLDCTVRLNFRGVTRESMKHFLEEITRVGEHYKAEECVVEIPDWKVIPEVEIPQP